MNDSDRIRQLESDIAERDSALSIAYHWISRAKAELSSAAASNSRDEWLNTPVEFLDQAARHLVRFK